MNTNGIFAFFCTIAILIVCQPAEASETCPRTIGINKAFVKTWSQANTWFGSEALAVVLPQDGIWPTTRPGNRIAVKLFWYSASLKLPVKPGFENEFVGRIERVDEGPNDAVISRPTNALLQSDTWTILTGIDFKSAGCWRVIGEYRGQSLEFVVETLY